MGVEMFTTFHSLMAKSGCPCILTYTMCIKRIRAYNHQETTAALERKLRTAEDNYDRLEMERLARLENLVSSETQVLFLRVWHTIREHHNSSSAEYNFRRAGAPLASIAGMVDACLPRFGRLPPVAQRLQFRMMSPLTNDPMS